MLLVGANFPPQLNHNLNFKYHHSWYVTCSFNFSPFYSWFSTRIHPGFSYFCYFLHVLIWLLRHSFLSDCSCRKQLGQRSPRTTWSRPSRTCWRTVKLRSVLLQPTKSKVMPEHTVVKALILETCSKTWTCVQSVPYFFLLTVFSTFS